MVAILVTTYFGLFVPMSTQMGRHLAGSTPAAAVYRVILPSLIPMPLRPRSPVEQQIITGVTDMQDHLI